MGPSPRLHSAIPSLGFRRALLAQICFGPCALLLLAGAFASAQACKTSLDVCVGDGGPALSAFVFSPQTVSVDGFGHIFIVVNQNGNPGCKDVVFTTNMEKRGPRA